MEPIATTATTVGLVLKGLQLVHKRREGRLAQEDAQELYARILASLLFEVRSNIKRCDYIFRESKKNNVSLGVLSFFVRDALFSDFCIMCPDPSTIAKLNDIYAGLERVHHWQRRADDHRPMLAYAKDFFEKKLQENYNELCSVLTELSPDTAAPEQW